MKNDKIILKFVKSLMEECNDYMEYVKNYNECAYSDRILESIIKKSKELENKYEKNFEDNRDKYKYEILNYWNNSDDLYVNYVVSNNDKSLKANAISYYNVSDIGCDYNNSSSEEIENCLLELIKQNNGCELDLPKVSELSDLLKYVYSFVCESESNMCHITDEDWKELVEEYKYTDKDFENLLSEIKKYNLEDYITIKEDEYKICAYGGLQCCFNDDTMNRSEELER